MQSEGDIDITQKMLTPSDFNLSQQCLRAQHYHAAVDWVLRYDIISTDENVSVDDLSHGDIYFNLFSLHLLPGHCSHLH
jgi:hypothetical protein